MTGTMCAAFQRTAALRPDAVALRTVGDAQTVTWAQYATRVRELAAGLHGLGVGPGDTVAMMMSNRIEFFALDIAAQHLGAIAFSVYNTLAPDQLTHVLTNSDAKVVCCEAQYVARIRATGAPIEHLVVVDDPVAGTVSLAELAAAAPSDFDFEAAWRAVSPEDVITLVYTSGTTGMPKGVQMLHRNVVAQTEAVQELWGGIGPDDRVLSYLPSAHIADRVSAIYLQQMCGTTVTAVADITQFPAALVDARPTWLGAVPRVWEKLKVGIEMRLAAETDPAKRAGIDWALDVARRRGEAALAHQPMPAALAAEWAKADAALFSGLRAAMGLDGVRYALSGAAPVAPETLAFFAGLGLWIVEAWGMSESCAVVTGTTVDEVRLGTVGKAIAGMELRLLDDGELVVRGPMVMRDYRHDPQRTADALDADGWLYTGDIATIDADGYVRIVDRKKDIIINAGGKNMSPANIENQIKLHAPLIGAMAIVGEARPYNAALVVLDPEVAAHYAAQLGIAPATAAELAEHPAVIAALAQGIGRGNANLSRVEQVKRFRVLPVFWEPGGDELTPTMKTKRKPIAQKYAAEMAELYREPRAATVHEPGLPDDN